MLLLGVIGGLLGSTFTYLNEALTDWRRRGGLYRATLQYADSVAPEHKHGRVHRSCDLKTTGMCSTGDGPKPRLFWETKTASGALSSTSLAALASGHLK